MNAPGTANIAQGPPPLGKLTPDAFTRLIAPHLGAKRDEVTVVRRRSQEVTY